MSSVTSHDMPDVSELTPDQICELFQQAQSFDIGVTATNLRCLLPMIYAIPSLVLSLRIIVLLVANRNREEFSSSFYSLFLASSIVDFFFYISYNYGERVMSAPGAWFLYDWLPRSGFVPTLFYFFYCYLMFADMLIPMMLSSNRLTAVVFPVYHRKLWSKITKFVLAFFFLTPILFSYHIWMTKGLVCKLYNMGNHTNEVYFYLVQEKESAYSIKLSFLMQIVSFVSSMSSLGMNSVTLVLLYIRSLAKKKDKQSRMGNPEIKLLALSLLMFTNQFMLCLIQIGFYALNRVNTDDLDQVMFVNNFFNILFEVQRFVIDLICLTPPWFLLLMSSSVRQKIFFWKKHQQQVLWADKTRSNHFQLQTITSVNKVSDKT